MRHLCMKGVSGASLNMRSGLLLSIADLLFRCIFSMTTGAACPLADRFLQGLAGSLPPRMEASTLLRWRGFVADFHLHCCVERSPLLSRKPVPHYVLCRVEANHCHDGEQVGNSLASLYVKHTFFNFLPIFLFFHADMQSPLNSIEHTYWAVHVPVHCIMCIQHIPKVSSKLRYFPFFSLH